MEKNIIIIEDDFKDFIHIKRIIDAHYTCNQCYVKLDFDTNIKESFINQLRASLIDSFQAPEENIEQEKIIHQLLVNLKGFCEEDCMPVYLIDYKLAGGGKDNGITGIRFKDKFLKKMYPDFFIPVLFITSANHSDKLDVEEYVNKVDDKTICDFQTKPYSNDWQRVQENILRFISKARLVKRERKDVPTEYEHD